MNLHFIPISNLVSDFIESNGLETEEVDESLVIKWGVDGLNMMNLQEQLRHKIAIIQVKNSKAILPMDFKTLLQAACNVKNKDFCPTKREKVVEWTQKTFETECDLNIRLVCDKCHKPSCEHQGSFEVDVDRLWELANPQIYYTHYNRFGTFGKGNSSYSPNFQLMKYATNDFHKADLILGDCPNLDCIECQHSFRIELPLMEVDFNEGEILISYLGRVLDENGDPQIPDHPDVIEAITHHIAHKWFKKEGTKRRDQFLLNQSNDAWERREYYMGIAKSVVEMPEFHEWEAFYDHALYRIFPARNINSRVNSKTADQYDVHGRALGI
jgi:aryl carrier-like protein